MTLTHLKPKSKSRMNFISLLVFLSISIVSSSTDLEEPQQQKNPDLAIQLGHTGPIIDLAWSPNGSYVCTLGSLSDQDGTLKIWHAESGRLVADLGFSTLTAFAWSPDGKQIAVADEQFEEVLIWDTSSGDFKGKLKETEKVSSIAWSPNGAFLAFHTKQGVQVWTTQSWQLKARLEESRGAWGPILWSAEGKYLVTASLIWEMPTVDAWARLEKYKPSWSGDDPAAFSPDGGYLAAGNDSFLRIWDIRTGQLVFENNSGLEIRSVSWSPDGRYIAAGSLVLSIWEVKQAEANGEKKISVSLFKEIKEHASWIQSAKWSPQGRYLATGSSDASALIWDTDSWKPVAELKGHQREIVALCWSPRGNQLATASSDRTARIWEPLTGKVISELKALVGGQTVASWSPDGKLLAMGGSESPVRVWDTRSGQVIAALSTPKRIDPTVAEAWKIPAAATLLKKPMPVSNVRSVAWSPDGDTLAVVTSNGTDLLEIWEPRSFKLKKRWQSVQSGARCIAWSPDGKYLAIAGSTSKKGESATKLLDIRNERVVAGADIQASEKDRISINSLSWSPDGKYLARGGDNVAPGIWDIERQRLAEPYVIGAHTAWSSDGRFYAIDSKIWDAKKRQFVTDLKREMIETKFWAQSPRLLFKALFSAEQNLSSLAFSPDSLYLAGGAGWVARVWEVATGRQATVLAGHRGDVNQVSWSPEGRFLFTASEDGSVKLWSIPEGKMLATLITVGEEKDWLISTPEGLFDGSPAAWKLIGWHSEAGNYLNVDSVEIFFNEFFYPGLLEDILAGKKPLPWRSPLQIDRRQPKVKIAVPFDTVLSASILDRHINVKVEVEAAPADNAHAKGSGARDLRLFRNGSLVKAWRGDVLSPGKSRAFLETTIPIVAGENRLTAYVFNQDNVKSSDATIAFKGDGKLERRGNAYILTIGIDTYANPDYALKYAAVDSSTFSRELEKQQTAMGSFHRVEAVSLVDSEAIKSNILEALARLAGQEGSQAASRGLPALERLAKVEPEDVLFVYFAGHGTAHGSQFYLIPHDLGYMGSRENLDDPGFKAILKNSISDRDLEMAFEGIDAARILLVIDSCNSGQALEAEERRRGPMNSKGLAQLAYEKGMSILTASQGYQAALEAAQLGHGLLTYALVEEGLKATSADSSPADGEIDVREWMDFATLRVPEIQMKIMEEAWKQGRNLVFADWERDIHQLSKRSLQRPRVFYRREIEEKPFIIRKK